jgi:nucleotide-binding universal stress UspA family protein
MAACIVCAVDGEAASRDALRTATALAWALGARLVVAHVARRPENREPLGAMSVDRAGGRPGATAGHIDLEELLSDEGLVDHVEVRLPIGAAADEILRCAREERASMIVLGNRERGALGSLARSFVSPAILSSAPCPVVVVREGASRWLEEPLGAGA